MKSFFKINAEVNQLVLVDAQDNEGRTPLQLAVASLKPDIVDVLLDNGADLSTFIFPNDFAETSKPRYQENRQNFKLRLASSAMIVIERLEKRGYEPNQTDALKIMKFFVENVLETSADVDEFWYKEEKFENRAKNKMISPSLSLYDFIQLQPQEAARRLTYNDYFEIARTNKLKFPVKYREACALHLCEMMSRRFFLGWAMEPFMRLTHHRLPLLCCDMILEELKNEDLYQHPDMYDDGEAKYDFIEFVVRTGYKDEPKVGEDGKPLLHRTTALHRAARRGRFHAPMVPLLFNIFNRFDVNYIDDRGVSHFMFACLFNCVEAVEKFLELGQDPNCHGKGKDLSPLVYALGNRSKDMVRLLLKYGADPNLSNCTAAMTPLHRLSFRLLDNELLDDSIMNVHIDLVEMIFEDCQDKYKPVNVEARNKFGDTALHFALKENMRKVVEVLLRRGADPNVADSYGSTALHIICKKKDGDVWAKMLFQVCDEISRIVQVDARDNEGRTPLQLAVANFKPDINSHQAFVIFRTFCIT
ncbi:unnamed protein product [Trichogramma brassicae]|uniref:ANK_REP_REGION domain-containing protein n=1 Tax=Trichogramma brassicae TaxID=86971 RepID=A0A6H5J593_9HYME|nr:unnamed protein product [Trichogramma brassicae]